MGSEERESSRSTEQQQLLEGAARMKAVSIFNENDLFTAAMVGDRKFLKVDVNNQPTDGYLLSKKRDEGNCNIIHIAAKRFSETNHQLNESLLEFIREALESLPPQTALSLLCAKEETYDYTPLHYAALRGHLPAIKLLVDIYNNSRRLLSNEIEECHSCPPWLVKNRFGDTPLHVSITGSRNVAEAERCALYLLYLDKENFCNLDNISGHTPLSLAIKSGFNSVAQVILKSGCQYEVVGPNGFNLLHFVHHSSVEVCQLLLEQHPELLKESDNIERCSVLHKWAEVGTLWPLQLLLELNKPSVIDMVCSVDHQGRTPLHVACVHNKISFVRELSVAYKQAGREASPDFEGCSLWSMTDKEGNTPFHLALSHQHDDEKFLLEIMSEDPNVVHITNYAGESPLFIAVCNGHAEVIRKILELPDPKLIGMPLRNDGCTVLHVMFQCEEKIGRILTERFWWLINSTDSRGSTVLHAAEQANVEWAIRLLSNRTNLPYAVKNAEFDWIEASKNGHSSALIAFISHCPDFLKICHDKNDSPLHHIKLKTLDEYKKFLANKLITQMKEICDYDNATPLHRALEREDILLAEALLTTYDLDMNKKDKNDKTAASLLAELCRQHQKWKMMCKRYHIKPELRPIYVKPTKRNLTEMRQSLSVVATLLATLTFAAGFTIPGGFDNKSGEAILARKAAFLVFMLADAIAMCCSLLAVFCLIWSMVCNTNDDSVILMDFSVYVLVLALYGTLVAFMTGIFAVISHVSLWAAILICVICSLVGISANNRHVFPLVKRLYADRQE